MNGRERIVRVLAGGTVDRPPILPILHAGLAGLFGVSLREYSSSAAVVAWASRP